MSDTVKIYLSKCHKCGHVGKFLLKVVRDTYVSCRKCGDIKDIRGQRLKVVEVDSEK